MNTTNEFAPRWVSRRMAGRIMVGVAVVGVVVSLVGTAVAWQFVGQLSRSSDRSLALGEDALVTLDATLDVAEEVIGAVDAGLEGVVSTLDVVADVVSDTATVSESTAALAGEIAPSIDGIDEALQSLESITGSIDTVLRQLSQIPFGPRYDPDTSFDAAVARVRADLVPIAESLEEAAAELGDFAEGSDALNAELAALVGDVEEVRRQIAGSEALLDAYRATTADALDLAGTTRDDLGTELARTRLLIVLLGLTFAVGQIVPAWVGRELLVTSRNPL
ncbi:hypothetical protein BH23ACT3_BH23ACT3_11510 [soil metagenome]